LNGAIPQDRNSFITGIEVTEEFVAAVNAKTIHFVTKQLYAPKMSFKYMSGEGQIMEGMS
jgi:hypothetical protein